MRDEVAVHCQTELAREIQKSKWLFRAVSQIYDVVFVGDISCFHVLIRGLYATASDGDKLFDFCVSFGFRHGSDDVAE